jgi:copper chaperone NosL
MSLEKPLRSLVIDDQLPGPDRLRFSDVSNKILQEAFVKKILYFMLAAGLVLTGTAAHAQPDDITRHPSCPYCGMDRAEYAYSRVYLQYDDGSSFGACSLHCAALDLGFKIDKTPVLIQVGDYNSKALIDAENAFWVVGGNKVGVMTKRAKWAFGQKEDAEAYIHANGGVICGFEDAMKAVYEDMYQDTRMIREKRKMKRMQKGKN